MPVTVLLSYAQSIFLLVSDVIIHHVLYLCDKTPLTNTVCSFLCTEKSPTLLERQ